MSGSTAAIHAQGTALRRVASIRRLGVLFLLSIPAAAATIWDEILLSGPIVFLVEMFGFLLGYAIFTLIWAALGIGALIVADFVWPWLSRERVTRRLRRVADEEQPEPTGTPLTVIIVGGVLILPTGAAAVLLFGDGVVNWIAEHPANTAVFVAVALVVFVILVAVDWLSRGIEVWVRTIADTAGPRLRSFAALATMVGLGPVLGWPVFGLLRYSRSSTYVMTLLAAPVFAAIWVPFYSLGVWGLVEGVA